MLSHDIHREMYMAFHRGPFRSMLHTLKHEREDSGGSYDPVTETTTGGSGGFSVDAVGLKRKVSRKIVDEVNITNDMMMFTMLQETAVEVPKANDTIVDSSSVPFRILDVKQDPSHTMYHLILKRAS